MDLERARPMSECVLRLSEFACEEPNRAGDNYQHNRQYQGILGNVLSLVSPARDF